MSAALFFIPSLFLGLPRPSASASLASWSMPNTLDDLEKAVDDETCVIVASCPGAKMAEVEPIIVAFKKEHKALKSNVNLGYCQKEGANKFL